MWLKNEDKHENNICVYLIVGVIIFLFERVYYLVSNSQLLLTQLKRICTLLVFQVRFQI